MTNDHLNIAVIPGDGIGTEVVPEGLRVLDVAAKRHNIDIRFDEFDFASCDYYQKHGQMMPGDWKDRIGGHDALFFGAVGWPVTVPDHVSLWGSLIQFRRQFDQYISLRPARLMPGMPCPLVGRHPDIDMWIVRENTEGEYSSIGGKMFSDTPREVVMPSSLFLPKKCEQHTTICKVDGIPVLQRECTFSDSAKLGSGNTFAIGGSVQNFSQICLACGLRQTPGGSCDQQG